MHLAIKYPKYKIPKGQGKIFRNAYNKHMKKQTASRRVKVLGTRMQKGAARVGDMIGVNRLLSGARILISRNKKCPRP